VLALACLSRSDPGKARETLLGNPTTALPEPTADCGQGTAQRALIAAQILGIRGTPFLIAPDGRMRQGSPEDLAAWLAGEGGDVP
jgi:thiol:disulfide interchange protein DsbC